MTATATAAAGGATVAATIGGLLAGNARFCDGVSEHCHDRTELGLANLVAQRPRVAVLSCADARVDPDIVFDAPLGGVFSVRIAGALATTEADPVHVTTVAQATRPARHFADRADGAPTVVAAIYDPASGAVDLHGERPWPVDRQITPRGPKPNDNERIPQ